MTCERNSERAFLGACALLFIASVASTVICYDSMSSMAELPMPGGWTMSMTWAPICGQTWLGAAASFLGMWLVMMPAMMLPSLVPLLWRYRQGVASRGAPRPGQLAALVGAGYFLVWTAIGMLIFPPGAALVEIALLQPELARAMPIAAGLMVTGAGLLQFTAWKARHLASCRQAPGSDRSPAATGTALRLGLRLGFHCCCSCAGPTVALLALGIMNLPAMLLVAAAITAERLAPNGQRLARITGAVAIGAGTLMIAHAAGFG